MVPTIIEVKTRVTSQTHQTRLDVVKRNDGNRLFVLDLARRGDRFTELVPSLDNRLQILHLATCGATKYILFLETTVAEIIYAVLVIANSKVQSLYRGFLLAPMLATYVKPLVAALDDVRDPAECGVLKDFNIEPGRTGGEEGFFKAYQMSEALYSLWEKRKYDALPLCRKIIPGVIDSWNLFMGAIDITSALVQNLLQANSASPTFRRAPDVWTGVGASPSSSRVKLAQALDVPSHRWLQRDRPSRSWALHRRA